MSANRDTANIELRINELVLHGFARGDRERIGAAVQQELLRQLTEQGIPRALLRQDNVPRLDASAIQIQQGGQAETIGRQVAQAVYGSVTGEQSRRSTQVGGNLKGSNIE